MKWFFALVLVLSSGLLRADKFDNEYEEKAWAEIAVQLPAFPKEADLLEFKVGSVVNTRFFIDGISFKSYLLSVSIFN